MAIIGPTLSNEMFAVGPVAHARKIPILGSSTTASGTCCAALAPIGNTRIGTPSRISISATSASVELPARR